jgi:hypothetical protein
MKFHFLVMYAMLIARIGRMRFVVTGILVASNNESRKRNWHSDWWIRSGSPFQPWSSMTRDVAVSKQQID